MQAEPARGKYQLKKKGMKERKVCFEGNGLKKGGEKEGKESNKTCTVACCARTGVIDRVLKDRCGGLSTEDE